MMNMMIGYTLWTGRVGRVGGTQIQQMFRCTMLITTQMLLKCKLLPSQEGLLVDDPGSDVQMRRDSDIYNLPVGIRPRSQCACFCGLPAAACCLLPADC